MRKIFITALFTLFAVVVLPFNAYLQEEKGEMIKMYMGEIKMLPVNTPTRIVIGNPNIADVSDVSKSDLAINPKAPGNTTLVIWDIYGEQDYNVKVFAENTNELKARVDSILKQLNMPDVVTKAEDEEDKVFLTGAIKTSQDRDRFLNALGALKDKIVDLMVIKEEETTIELDVQVFEIDRGSEEKLGFTWPSSISLTEVGSPGISAGGTSSWAKLFKIADLTRGVANPYTLTFDALLKEGKIRILSRPRIACQSGKEAKLLVGGQVPVLSGSVTPSTTPGGGTGQSTGASVEYKDYGIVLNVKPRLEDNGRIHLNLNVEVSDLGVQVSTTFALAYTFLKRNATTELYLDDGQTMGIGGLIKKKTQEELQKVPWLADVPVLGKFFKNIHTITGSGTTAGTSSSIGGFQDTELFITLTPRIVGMPNSGLRKAKEELKPSSLSAVDESTLSPTEKYARIIQKRVLDNLIYPAPAKKAGFKGMVTLSLKLSPQGDLMESKIKSASGYKVLDDAALTAAQNTGAYPPFPPQIQEKELWIDVPIIFQLD